MAVPGQNELAERSIYLVLAEDPFIEARTRGLVCTYLRLVWKVR